MVAAGEKLRPAPEQRRPDVWVCPTAEAAAAEAARRVVEVHAECVAARGEFMLALAGGNTPRALYRLLVSPEFREQIDWAHIHLFWSDERTVPPEHPDSNYGMAAKELLAHVTVPQEHIHRMEADWPSLGRAAQVYEVVLRNLLPLDSRGFPRLDMILLGMGADGHTASLFPGEGNPAGTSRWISTPTVEKLGTRRMTMTLPVLNAARHVLFLIVGAEKAEALPAVVEGTPREGAGILPAGLVQPIAGERVFIVDAAAASRLQS
jgi:6-phosphogluconolactonase